MREIMPEVKIEALTFPKEDLEIVEINQDNLIRVRVTDKTLVNIKKFKKWINICGTLDGKIVEQVSIGKIYFETEKFRLRCKPSMGIAGKIPCTLDIYLDLVNEGNGDSD